MKRYLYKTSLFTIPIIIVLILLIYCAGGSTDPFYVRFTTPKHANMILGTSRAAQGLQPSVFKDILHKNIGNYAFTVTHSPFGKVYLESIQLKHSKENNSIFIIAVDPWSISSWCCASPNNIALFRENRLFLNHMTAVDLNPNIEYLAKNIKNLQPLISPDESMYLHEDGWLEISKIPMDSISVAKRISNKVELYTNNHLPKTHFSSLRLSYLKQTVNYLKEYGMVYLVRLPIHPQMMEIENQLMPDFDQKIQEITHFSNGYLDLTPMNDLFLYTDGNHLYKDSGAKVSKLIADWIKK